jgi:hypothetical protein
VVMRVGTLSGFPVGRYFSHAWSAVWAEAASPHAANARSQAWRRRLTIPGLQKEEAWGTRVMRSDRMAALNERDDGTDNTPHPFYHFGAGQS